MSGLAIMFERMDYLFHPFPLLAYMKVFTDLIMLLYCLVSVYISPYNIETSSYKILFLPEDKGEVWDAAVNITNLWVV